MDGHALTRVPPPVKRPDASAARSVIHGPCRDRRLPESRCAPPPLRSGRPSLGEDGVGTLPSSAARRPAAHHTDPLRVCHAALPQSGSEFAGASAARLERRQGDDHAADALPSRAAAVGTSRCGFSDRQACCGTRRLNRVEADCSHCSSAANERFSCSCRSSYGGCNQQLRPEVQRQAPQTVYEARGDETVSGHRKIRCRKSNGTA